MYRPCTRTLASLVATASLVAAASAVVTSVPARAAVDGVFCGVVSQYTAPDPGLPADGTITIGFDQTSTIAADAALSPAAAAGLPNLIGNSPTCLAIEADAAGVITGLDFASIGTVCGTVEIDEVSGFYVVADAFVVPISLVESEVGFMAMFGVAADAGSELCITFIVDVASGFISGFSGTTAACGAPTVRADGSVEISGATIPASVPTDNAHAAAQFANGSGDEVCVEVTTTGSIDTQTGQLALNPMATFAFDHCGVVTDGVAGALVVDGMDFQPAGGNVERSVRTGMRVTVAGAGEVTIDSASVPGCSAAAATPEPTATPEPAASTSAEPSIEPSPSEPESLGTLPDTAAGPSLSGPWWLVMVAAIGLSGLGLLAHLRHASARVRVARWKAR